MNISEFERLKPTKTYESIQKAKKYFEKLKKENSPPMTDEDAARKEEANRGLGFLREIEKNFLAGK